MALSKQQLKIRNFWKKRPKLITREIRDIIHGYIMSDGYLNEQGTLQLRQCLDQSKFFDWLYEKLKTIRTETPIHTSKNPDKRTEAVTYSRGFSTRALLKGFHSMWYKPNPNPGKPRFIKKLPNSIKAIMSPTVLTLWFAGDGTKIKESRGAKIEVTSFTVEERLKLQSLLDEKLQLPVEVNKAGTADSGTPQWTINFNAPSYTRFRELITQIDLIENVFPNKLHRK